MASSCVFYLGGKFVRGNGQAAERTIEVTDFNSIAVKGALDVIFTQAPLSPVLIHSDENLLDLYKIEVIGGTLIVSTEEHTNLFPRVKSYITVSSELLESASVSGSGDLLLKSALSCPADMELSVAGSGDIVADRIECGSLQAKVSGSGDIHTMGVVCDDFEVRVTGSGDIKSGPVTARSVDASVSGSGDITLSLKDAGDVNARISGSGDITLRGNARSISKKVSGSGDLHTAGLSLEGFR